MEIWDAFQHTGWVGKGVLATLLLFSILSWGVIVAVWLRFWKASRASKSFLKTFRKSKRLVDVHGATAAAAQSPLVTLFKAGYAEIEAQITAQGANKIKSIDGVGRSLQRAVRTESARLTRTMPFLATTAAATPFIGLFGTVWGIMGAFQSIGSSGSTSIVAVAPGISEALINTAAGLFAAIPALIAYNHFMGRLRQSRGEMEDFALELLNLTERNFT